jgi:hypothetical protein
MQVEIEEEFVTARTVAPVSSPRHWGVDIAHDAAARLPVADPDIDDPVDNTGLGPRRGDLQLFGEFACLVRLMCEEGGTFS